MIIVPVKDGENIERALKKFKRKFEKTGVVKELRARQQYTKPSVLKRLKMQHAIYVQKPENCRGLKNIPENLVVRPKIRKFVAENISRQRFYVC